MAKYRLIKEYPGTIGSLGIIATGNENGDYDFTLNNSQKTRKTVNKAFIEDCSEWWEKIFYQDFTILSFRQKSGITDIGWCRNTKGNPQTFPYTTEEILNNPLYKIHSVKRNSDGAIFTTGEYAQYKFEPPFKILKIKVSKNLKNFCVVRENKNIDSIFNFVEVNSNIFDVKPRTFLLTTEDGYRIFDGEKIFILFEGMVKQVTLPKTNSVFKGTKEQPVLFFSSEVAALKYADKNKIISLDLENLVQIYKDSCGVFGVPSEFFRGRVLEFLKTQEDENKQ